jgi:hypothetical protein
MIIATSVRIGMTCDRTGSTDGPIATTFAAMNVTAQKIAAICGMTFATAITKTLVATRATFAKTSATLGMTAENCAMIGKIFAATVAIYALIGGIFVLIAGSSGSRQFVSSGERPPEQALRNLPIWSGS